jgi:hypothetical protein
VELAVEVPVGGDRRLKETASELPFGNAGGRHERDSEGDQYARDKHSLPSVT